MKIMVAIMELDGYIEQWLADEVPPDLLLTPLPDSIANGVVDHLKDEADRFWSIDPNYSLKYADRIIAIGNAREDKLQIALGMMARGDALKLLGSLQEAWEMLEKSGNMFESAGDLVGWARTRIGRLFLGLNLNRIPETLADVERAEVIFNDNGEQEKRVRLEINTAYVYTRLGEQHKALCLYQSALTLAETLGENGQQHLGMLHMNIGYVYESLGDYPQAISYYEQARAIYIARDETLNIINVELNIAYIAQLQGHYQLCLRLLYGILERGISQSPLEEQAVKQDLAECYLYLNRYVDARNLARQIVSDYEDIHSTYDMARTLLHLAIAEAELGNYSVSKIALENAKSIFISLGANTWTMLARLRMGQITLKQGDISTARQEALAAVNYFEAEEQQVNYASASLLLGQVSLASEDYDLATKMGVSALQIAQRFNVPSLRHAAHLLLGQVTEAQKETNRAVRHYQAATATIERVQRGLTITLRPGFLENKEDAWKALIGLYLRSGQEDRAFESLERAKSQVLLSYINNREQFRWDTEDPQNQALIKELDLLRAEHHTFYQLVNNPPKDLDTPIPMKPEQALSEVLVREKRMRAITEHLYLRSSKDNVQNASLVASLIDIHDSLDEHTFLLEFYNDGEYLWAFLLDEQNCNVQRLSIKVKTFNQLLTQLQVNLAAALKIVSISSAAHKLTQSAQLILQRLYTLLIEPLSLQNRGRSRLVIVPYSTMHYLPFHLLYDGSKYLVENFEVVILPSASLIVHPGPKREPGALILAHSWDGRLSNTLTESQIVQQIFGGTLYLDTAATRNTLQRMPSQVLHIAAHGEHRLDQPGLSFLELADGQLYADDLLQQDLSYELVTLSACETGRANVAANDELIGLGRGLLYAGAGALLLSLWQVPDISTVDLMENFYSALHAGSSKSAALREAQLFFLKQDRQMHPALWGAFQLIGDARPLSVVL